MRETRMSRSTWIGMVCLAVMILIMSGNVQGGWAGPQNQTIPTAPPPTATVNPTRAPTNTQPNPPLPSATAAAGDADRGNSDR